MDLTSFHKNSIVFHYLLSPNFMIYDIKNIVKIYQVLLFIKFVSFFIMFMINWLKFNGT